MKGEIIKCKNCGFKYYDGNVHECVPVKVTRAEEKPEAEEKSKARKVAVKTEKESFKVWKDN